MKQINDTLFIIPARGGSKGLPGKNIIELRGKPLIYYTIDAARGVSSDEHICVSTDDVKIIDVVKNYGIDVPFVRPQSLSSDNADTWDAVEHAIDYYKKLGKIYKRVCLLQPTSPLRNSAHILDCIRLWDEEFEMIVSVKKSKKVAVICHEENGFLKLTLNRKAKRRQDFQNYYEYNGAIYLLNVNSFKQKQVKDFTKIKKYVMAEEASVDIDDEKDMVVAEYFLKKGKVE